MRVEHRISLPQLLLIAPLLRHEICVDRLSSPLLALVKNDVVPAADGGTFVVGQANSHDEQYLGNAPPPPPLDTTFLGSGEFPGEGGRRVGGVKLSYPPRETSLALLSKDMWFALHSVQVNVKNLPLGIV